MREGFIYVKASLVTITTRVVDEGDRLHPEETVFAPSAFWRKAP